MAFYRGKGKGRGRGSLSRDDRSEAGLYLRGDQQGSAGSASSPSLAPQAPIFGQTLPIAGGKVRKKEREARETRDGRDWREKEFFFNIIKALVATVVPYI
jgi:hypothetical protein